MKTFTTILLLSAFSLVKSTSPAVDVVQKSPGSLALVLIDDHVVFITATNISMVMNVPSTLGFCLPTTIQDWKVRGPGGAYGLFGVGPTTYVCFGPCRYHVHKPIHVVAAGSVAAATVLSVASFCAFLSRRK